MQLGPLSLSRPTFSNSRNAEIIRIQHAEADRAVKTYTRDFKWHRETTVSHWGVILLSCSRIACTVVAKPSFRFPPIISLLKARYRTIKYITSVTNVPEVSKMVNDSVTQTQSRPIQGPNSIIVANYGQARRLTSPH